MKLYMFYTIITWIVALIFPRLFALYVWLTSKWFDGVYPNQIYPILGFLFVPRATLWYSVVSHWYHGVWGADAIGCIGYCCDV